MYRNMVSSPPCEVIARSSATHEPTSSPSPDFCRLQKMDGTWRSCSCRALTSLSASHAPLSHPGSIRFEETRLRRTCLALCSELEEPRRELRTWTEPEYCRRMPTRIQGQCMSMPMQQKSDAAPGGNKKPKKPLPVPENHTKPPFLPSFSSILRNLSSSNLVLIRQTVARNSAISTATNPKICRGIHGRERRT